jgi:type IX secretion system PorP/SprF family membrane protein
MKKIMITAVLALVCLTKATAQQDPMVSQYLFNGLYLNPAYAGSHKYWSSTLSYRRQWVGFDGAPQTIIGAVDGPIASKNMGLGLIFFNDQIGVTRQNSVMANYAYRIRVSETGRLALGISAGISQFSAKLTDLTVWDTDDQVFQNDLTSKVIPRFGFGIYYSDENWFAGFSIPTLLAYQKGRDFSVNVNKASFMNRHYLLTGGYIFTLSDNVKLKPSVLLKYLPNAPLQADINLGVLLKDMFWIGGSFRSGDAGVIMLEYQSNSYFRIGYAYDMTFSALRNHSHGSHEIMIGIDFGKDLVKTKTPRYF